jgi:hypothetical protein
LRDGSEWQPTITLGINEGFNKQSDLGTVVTET